MTTPAESALVSLLTAIEAGDADKVNEAATAARAMYEDAGPLNFHARIEVESRLWCQLLLDEITARGAWARVQENAELYLDLGLIDLPKVLDALKIDEAGWAERVERNRQRKADNVAASREREQREQQKVAKRVVSDPDIGCCDDCGSEDGEREPWRRVVTVDGEPTAVTAWLCEACRG
jgi:hypothetical protein